MDKTIRIMEKNTAVMASNEDLRSAMIAYMSEQCSAYSSHLQHVISQVSPQALCDAILAHRCPADPNTDAANSEENVLVLDEIPDDYQAIRVITPPVRNNKLAIYETLLGFVVNCEYSDIALCILHKLDPHLEIVLLTKNEYSETPIYHAACNGDIALLTAMLKPLSIAQRKNVLAKADSNGYTPLHAAAYLGHTEAIKCVLSFVNSDSKLKLLALESNKEHTVISTAAWADRSEVVIYLLEVLDIQTRYATLAKPDTKGWTVLHLATYYGYTETLKSILEFLSSETQQHESLVLPNGTVLEGAEASKKYLLSLENADGKTVWTLATANAKLANEDDVRLKRNGMSQSAYGTIPRQVPGLSDKSLNNRPTAYKDKKKQSGAHSRNVDFSKTETHDQSTFLKSGQQQGLFRIKPNKTNKRYEDIRHNGADINNHYAIHKCERIQSELKTFPHESQIPEHGATTIPPNTTPEGPSRSYAPKRVHTKKSSGSLIQSLTQSLEEAKKLKSDEAKMSAAERSMEARELISTKSASQREEDMETGGHDFAQSVATLEDDVLAAFGSFRRHHKLPARGKEEHSGRKTHLKRKVPVPPPKPAQTLRVEVAGDDSQLRNQLEHFIQQRTDSTSSQDAMTESCVDWVMVEERPPTPPVAEQPIVQDSYWIETTRRMFST